MLPFLLALAALAGRVAADSGQVAYTFPNMSVTYYYDNNQIANLDPCGRATAMPKDWSKPTNLGSTACGKSVRELGTNAVIALNSTWMSEVGKGNLCGREVQIWKDGHQVHLLNGGGGPFVLWEACQACITLPRIDMSVEGYVAASGDTKCQNGVVGGFEVRVMDNFVLRAGASRRAALQPATCVAVLAAALLALLAAS
ncbi:uncharacterized protein LOC62_05G006895 [Vanrija pseudolonga]|uniref:Uncharacterized protein n=1 Tax=Vanrija pseudolonga TaxID=143232 RepID=A0AAF0YF26_9TREE|nr:hypothetical protein LOC62_05G006895 [Vanrija pseudolonga]